MDNLSLSNENNSEPESVLADTELVKDNQSTEEEHALKDATEGSMTQNASGVLADTELVKDNQSTEEELAPKDATEGSMTQNADQPEKVQVKPRPKEPKKVQDQQRKSARIMNNKRKNEVASSSGATHEMKPTKRRIKHA